MRYENRSDLPRTIRDVLPEPGQDIYLRAYQKAWDMYTEGQGYLSRDVMAHQQGWTALQHEYVQDQGTGKWRRIGEAPTKEKARRGLLARLMAAVSGPRRLS
jgi:cation transport regulator